MTHCRDVITTRPPQPLEYLFERFLQFFAVFLCKLSQDDSDDIKINTFHECLDNEGRLLHKETQDQNEDEMPSSSSFPATITVCETQTWSIVHIYSPLCNLVTSTE